MYLESDVPVYRMICKLYRRSSNSLNFVIYQHRSSFQVYMELFTSITVHAQNIGTQIFLLRRCLYWNCEVVNKVSVPGERKLSYRKQRVYDIRSQWQICFNDAWRSAHRG